MPVKIDNPNYRPLIIPDATLTQAGVVTLAQLNTPGPFTALGLLNGFAAFPAIGNLGTPEARVVGDVVQLAGTVQVPNAGTPGAALVAVLPASQRPSKVRFLATSVCDLGASAAPNLIIIDDAAGTFSATPGAVILNFAVGAAVGKALCLDGLNFVLGN